LGLARRNCAISTVDFSPPEDAEKDWTLFQQLRAGSIQNYQLDKRYFRRDGSLVWGRLSISLLNSDSSPLVLAMVEDITDKKQAEDSRFRHSAVIESSDDAIASGTLDGIIVSWNTGAQKMYGYTEAEAVGKPINMLVPPELPDEENKILETLRAGGRIEHLETIRVTKTGKRINVSLSISPIRDSSGRIVGISGIARDITERKQAEEALRASEERLRLAQQAARIGSFERDVRTGRITWAEGLDSLYGLPPGSVDGKTLAFFMDLVHSADRERVAHLIQEALKTGQPTEGEWRAIWPDGSIHWIVSRWQVLMDDSGEPSRVAGVNMDVTEHKLAEQALHAHEELLKIFVKNVPAAVAMLDRDMHYLQVSDRWRNDYLSGREQIIGRSHYEIFPDMPERWKEVHRRGLQGETLRADEDRWDGQDGSHWARWEVRPWNTPEGTVGGILILSEDITRRKQMEEILAGTTRKLIEAQEQERSRIGRELHDDIGQRIAMLSNELQGLQDHPSERQSRVQELRRRMSEISDDMQALSHDLHSSKLQYLGVVAGIRSWCKEFGARHGMVIDFRSEASSVLAPELGLTIFRVVQEALHNAMKHSGVKRAEVLLEEDSNGIHLIVRDSGRGFEMEEAAKGPGLGLTSMSERVRLVNGTITIDSKPMGGTRVHVHLPVESNRGSQRAAV
jgi:PAS domain S-box-containing protein